MANNKVYTEAVVTLNGEEAKARIGELQAKAADLRLEMAKLAATKGIDSKEFKKVQKELVATTNAQKKLNEDTAKFQKIINNINGSSLNELQSAARKLEQQMRRLKPGTDEFVAASKKLKEVRGRMDEINASAKNTQGMLGSFFSKIGWAGILSAAGAAFVKFGKDLINTTQTWGDKWGVNMAGAKQAYQTFIADLASGKGWRELIANMRESFRVGKEVQMIMDEIFERQNSLTLKEAEYNVIIEEQKKKMRDTSLSSQERLDAANEVMRLELELAQARKEIAADETAANKKLLQDKTNLTDAEIEKFLVEYNNNRSIISQANEYRTTLAKLQQDLSNAQAGYKDVRSATSASYVAKRVEAAQKALAEFEASTDENVKWWAEVSAKYDRGNDELVTNYVNSRVKMIETDAQFHRDTARASTQAGAMRKQISSENQKAVDEAFNKEIASSEAHYKALELQAKESYAAGELSQAQYNARIAALQEAGLKDKIRIAENYKRVTIEYQSELMDLTIKQKEEFQKLLDSIEKDAMSISIEMMNEAEEEIEDYMDELDAEFEQQLENLIAMQERAAEIRKELDPIKALLDERQKELDEVKNLYEMGLLTEEEYLEKSQKIKTDYFAKGAELMYDNFNKWASAASNLVTSLQDAEAAHLDAQMEKELTAAGDNAEARAAIEEEYEQKKLDLQKKYANINMTIQIAQTIASGALAAVKAVAELGPIAGGIMAGVIAATTAAQVAVIVAQRNAIMNASVDTSSSSSPAQIGQREVTGYEDGGFTTPSSSDSTAVGIVHANEWVAPAAMVRANPVVFARLESARKSMNRRSGLPGFADGGMTGGSLPSAETLDNALLSRLLGLLEDLKASMPIKAYVITSEINKENDFQEAIKKIVGKQ